jgi:hypothetical protein
LEKVIKFSQDISGQTNFEEIKMEMKSSMKHIILTSTEFLTAAKIVSLDPWQAQSRINLTQSTRYKLFGSHFETEKI